MPIKDPVKRKEYEQKRYQQNKEKFKEQFSQYHQKNKEKILGRHKEYRHENREKIREINRVYQKKREKEDPGYKLARRLRNRLYYALKNNQRAGSAIKDLGCSIEELKEHIEKQFQPGMSWDKWTTDGFHIDHIKPLCSFDLTDRQQFLEAVNYKNLRPLWAKENMAKGGRNSDINSK